MPEKVKYRIVMTLDVECDSILEALSHCFHYGSGWPEVIPFDWVTAFEVDPETDEPADGGDRVSLPCKALESLA